MNTTGWAQPGASRGAGPGGAWGLACAGAAPQVQVPLVRAPWELREESPRVTGRLSVEVCSGPPWEDGKQLSFLLAGEKRGNGINLHPNDLASLWRENILPSGLLSAEMGLEGCCEEVFVICCPGGFVRIYRPHLNEGEGEPDDRGAPVVFGWTQTHPALGEPEAGPPPSVSHQGGAQLSSLFSLTSRGMFQTRGTQMA